MTVGSAVFDGGLRARARPRRPPCRGVLLAYTDTVDRVFYMTTGLAALTFALSWGMGWRDIRKNQQGQRWPV